MTFPVALTNNEVIKGIFIKQLILKNDLFFRCRLICVSSIDIFF